MQAEAVMRRGRRSSPGKYRADAPRSYGDFPRDPAFATLCRMFQALLKEVVDATDGAIASCVMELEGVPLDSYSKPDTTFDIKNIGIELSIVVKQIKTAAEMLEAGEAHEVAIVAEQITTLVRMVSANYFVALSLEPRGNLGKARFILRTRAGEMARELG